MKNKISLRLKLSDFINTEIESEIMEQVSKTHNDSRVAVLLYLCYDVCEIPNDDLKNFLMRWEDKLSFRTIVKQGSKLRPNDFIWFDVIPHNIEGNTYKRFSYYYKNKNQILNGLREFYQVTKFITSDKPVKRQKRNDYED